MCSSAICLLGESAARQRGAHQHGGGNGYGSGAAEITSGGAGQEEQCWQRKVSSVTIPLPTLTLSDLISHGLHFPYVVRVEMLNLSSSLLIHTFSSHPSSISTVFSSPTLSLFVMSFSHLWSLQTRQKEIILTPG